MRQSPRPTRSKVPSSCGYNVASHSRATTEGTDPRYQYSLPCSRPRAPVGRTHLARRANEFPHPDVRRAHPPDVRLLRAPGRADPQHRPPGRARRAFRQRLLQSPDLRAVAGQLLDRPLHPRDRQLGQLPSLHRHRGRLVGPPPGRGRSPGHLRRQAPLPP